ncbi:MAG: hypothetical protein WC222_08860 [Parachlamydiales bacterium]|jgi:hypothetical protein
MYPLGFDPHHSDINAFLLNGITLSENQIEKSINLYLKHIDNMDNALYVTPQGYLELNFIWKTCYYFLNFFNLAKQTKNVAIESYLLQMLEYSVIEKISLPEETQKKIATFGWSKDAPKYVKKALRCLVKENFDKDDIKYSVPKVTLQGKRLRVIQASLLEFHKTKPWIDPKLIGIANTVETLDIFGASYIRYFSDSKKSFQVVLDLLHIDEENNNFEERNGRIFFKRFDDPHDLYSFIFQHQKEIPEKSRSLVLRIFACFDLTKVNRVSGAENNFPKLYRDLSKLVV